MILAGDLRQGVIFETEGEMFQVLDFRRHKMARAKAVVNVKAKNIQSGGIREFTFRSTENVGEPDVLTQSIEFVYYDERKGELVLSDPDTKKRYTLPSNILSEEQIGYLSSGTVLYAITNGKPNELQVFSVSLPNTVDLKVTQAPPADKGNTASGGTKAVTVETGKTVNTPFFIKQDDIIRVNTSTGSYVERVTE